MGLLAQRLLGLFQQFLDLETKELKIKQKYLKKIEEDLTPVLATRFYHVETKLNLMINLQVATRLPFVVAP